MNRKNERFKTEVRGTNIKNLSTEDMLKLALDMDIIDMASVEEKIEMDDKTYTLERMTAFVKCAGDCEKAKENYKYSGVEECTVMPFAPNGGSKACTYGCMGYGSCVKACPFDAIHIVNGIAVVDKEKCKACGKCVATCPRHLIELIPYESKYTVKCASKDKGKDVMPVCSTGCIGCMLCTKQCEFGAITVENNIAHIDYEKCTGCGKCAEKCPKKIIHLH